MIIVKIVGGLGNQMFQYALGRALAHKNKTDLKLDISEYENRYKLHRYSLQHLNIDEKIATAEEIKRLKDGDNPRILLQLLKIFKKTPIVNSAKSHIIEKKFSFDEPILSLGDNIYLDGYWQSEKYFTNIQDIIRREFQIKTPPNPNNESMIKRIKTTDAVAVHIRRGDYVSDKNANSVHGSATLNYYTKAAKIIIYSVKSPTFFIFSDDPQWVKENLSLPNSMIFIDHNGPEKNYEDLRLMSFCKHHIIANSTFSWWGAWLANNENQKVIAPLKWFNNNTDTRDLIPAHWERI